MSIYLQIYDQLPMSLASNKGWGDVCRLVEKQPRAKQLGELVGRGQVVYSFELLVEINSLLYLNLQHSILTTLLFLKENLAGITPGSTIGVTCGLVEDLVENFNPHHDEKGRFTTADKAAGVHRMSAPLLGQSRKKGPELVKRDLGNSSDQNITTKVLFEAKEDNESQHAKDLAGRYHETIFKHDSHLEKIRSGFIKSTEKAEREYKKAEEDHNRAMKLHGPHLKFDSKASEKQKAQRKKWLEKSADKLYSIEKERNKIKADLRDSLDKHLNISNPVEVKVWGINNVSQDMQTQNKLAVTWLERAVDKKVLHGNRLEVELEAVDRGDGRSAAGNKHLLGGSYHTLLMDRAANSYAYIHELGHTVEFSNKRVEDLARGFLYHRVHGESPRHYIDGGPKEVGFDDQFNKAFGTKGRYVGKYYAQHCTEVISMGLEQMYRDPVHFARNDPEYFKFMIGVMRGDFHG